MGQFPLLKVIIAGDENVGKTSLVRRYVEGTFSTSPIMTIGVDIQTRVVQLPTSTVKLSMWDLAGQDRFESVRAGFYRGSLATALVYDLSAPESLRDLARWYKEVIQVVPHQRFIVVGNKSDLVQEPVDRIGQQLASVIHADYMRTSALNGEGVAQLFERLAAVALSSAPAISQSESNAPAA